LTESLHILIGKDNPADAELAQFKSAAKFAKSLTVNPAAIAVTRLTDGRLK
jgi:hypothetical protein